MRSGASSSPARRSAAWEATRRSRSAWAWRRRRRCCSAPRSTTSGRPWSASPGTCRSPRPHPTARASPGPWQTWPASPGAAPWPCSPPTPPSGPRRAGCAATWRRRGFACTRRASTARRDACWRSSWKTPRPSSWARRASGRAWTWRGRCCGCWCWPASPSTCPRSRSSPPAPSSTESPFPQYALPQAILRFRQGFGRLIRTSADRGVVVVLDRRITSRSYGDQFLRSLPGCTVSRPTLRELPAVVARWLGG